MPERIGEQPRPRLLILGIEADEWPPSLNQLAPTVRFSSLEKLRSIRQKDWDAIVVFGNAWGIEDHLYVIQFGGTVGSQIPCQTPGAILQIDAVSVATQFEIPDNLPDSIKPLIKPSLVKLLKSKSPNQVMQASVPGHTSLQKPDITQPFICDPDGYVLAGCFVRPETSTRWWWLPDGIETPEQWIAAAFADWANVDPVRFPIISSWQARQEWQTPAEVDLAARILAARENYETVLAELEQEGLRLNAELETAVASANATVRRLVTAQGDELVEEVQATFEELGLTVTNVDREIANPGDRREDLRVSFSGRPGWTALVEVRGYKRGAQLNDLLRISRFVTRYLRETNRMPDAAWYVVNHFLEQDPAVRPLPLVSNPLEVQTFGEDHGLIIDSRSLFQLRMKARRGELQLQDARTRLLDACGLFEE